MGSIDRRIEALERAYGTKPREEDPEERRRIIDELEALRASARPEAEERMAREEAEGNFTRRRALEDLEARIKERVRRRTNPSGSRPPTL